MSSVAPVRPLSVELWPSIWTLHCFSNPWCACFETLHLARKSNTYCTHSCTYPRYCTCIQVENPFLEKFYGNPKRYAFPMQMWFLRQRFGTYLRAIEMLFNTQGGKPVRGIIMDRSVSNVQSLPGATMLCFRFDLPKMIASNQEVGKHITHRSIAHTDFQRIPDSGSVGSCLLGATPQSARPAVTPVP